MKIHNQQNQETQRRYDLLKPLGMTNLAPRQGYYLILKVSKDIIAGVECTTAMGMWKQTENENFDLDFHITIQLKSLEGKHSKGPKHKLSGFLIKSVIHVMNAKVITINNEKVFSVEWDLLNNTTSFPTGSFDENEPDQQLIWAVAESNDEDSQVLNAISAQLDMNEEVMQAILSAEDEAYDGYDAINEWIFALQAQHLPIDNQNSNSNY